MRLTRLLHSKNQEFACLYGRRRCGKSRLLREVLPGAQTAYYLGDEREASLQRMALAVEIARVLPNFDQVSYPDWDALLQRWWREAPPGAILAIDEFPYLVQNSPELPSCLQKCYDTFQEKSLKLILCGSSQAMMHGLVLDAAAPLYGRATEIMKIEALRAGWITEGLSLAEDSQALLAYTLWGGIPRYWELAADYDSVWQAYEQLVLDPMGVMHLEPERLLHEDLRDPAQSISILSLIGQGCHRVSEVAGRLGKPASSLSRPFAKLLDLGLIHKEIPFKSDPRKTKQALYKIHDPFLATWYKHVLPSRSLLERGVVELVSQSMRHNIQQRTAACWEDLARDAIPFLGLTNRQWLPASRWWGTSLERSKIELDIVAESADGTSLLLGEVKLSLSAGKADKTRFELERKAQLFPLASRYQKVECFIFAANLQDKPSASLAPHIIPLDRVLAALK
jgi:AAA+ ATPase superfamily predicted ATPase